MRSMLHGWIGLLAGAALLGSAAGADWPQAGFDPAHSGNNVAETALGAGNVDALAPSYSVPFSGTDAPPVFVEQVTTAQGVLDLLFATTDNGVAAIDAATGATVWVQSASQFEYSIGASPAVDPGRQFVYGPGSDGRVHKLLAADGSEVVDASWPVVSSAKPATEKASSPLTIATNAQGASFLYSATSSYSESGDFQGHITAIDLASGSANVFNAACSDLAMHFVANGTPGIDDCASQKNGVWGRGGATYDAATDRIYFTTGNGVFDAASGGYDWGDTVLALNPDGTGAGNGLPLDSYTPTEYQDLEMFNADLGGGSPAVLPALSGSAVAHLGLQMGKDGVLRLLDMDNLSGQAGPAHIGGELQKTALLPGGFGNYATPQPAIWTDVHGDGAVWVFASVQGVITALQASVANGVPQLEVRWSVASMSNSSSPIVANDVLYAVTDSRYSASVKAFDPRTGALLWTSPPIDGCCHTQAPIVVNGNLYLASASTLVKFAQDRIFRSTFE